MVLSAQQITVLEISGSNAESLPQRPAWQEVHRILPLLLTKPKAEVEQSHRSEQQQPFDELALGEGAIWKPAWNMVFMWQCPMMFMSYSLTMYLLGLTLYICSPLITGDWGSNTNVSSLATLSKNCISTNKMR